MSHIVVDVDNLNHWLRPALQGLPFWVGLRRVLYPHYPLPEAALVAEICNLIQGKLPTGHILRCEVQYSEFLGKTGRIDCLPDRSRVDLVVEPREYLRKKNKGRTFLIEVKRAKATKKLIEDDLFRLALVKSHKERVRAGLIVVSEAYRPKDFVNDKGNAIRKRQKTTRGDVSFRVRGIVKATSTFRNIESAHYVCFLEVDSYIQLDANLERGSDGSGRSRKG